MRASLQELYNKLAGRIVFIVAGGPSVKTQDLTPLESKATIALNNSYLIVPNATALYWADVDWAAEHSDKLENHPSKLRFNAKFHVPDTVLEKDQRGTAGAYMLRRISDRGFVSNPNHVCGSNSGAQAINLAVNMGARKIVLLGYDMCIKEGQTHWHGGHGKAPVTPDVYANNFIPSIMSMAEPINRMGVEVVNATPQSKLKCFPYVPYESLV